jgi:hypothetical protein
MGPEGQVLDQGLDPLQKVFFVLTIRRKRPEFCTALFLD